MAIKHWILAGSLLPGARLPSEDELALRFGVSRPTVRVALGRLRSLQVISSDRGKNGGHRVREFSAGALAQEIDGFITLDLGRHQLTYAQLLQVRYELDLLAASAAAVHRTESDLAALVDLERLLTSTIDLDDVELALRYDTAFHQRLAACADNPLLASFISATIVAYLGSDADHPVTTPDRIVEHLDEVLEAVRAGDPDAAREAMRRHLSHSVEILNSHSAEVLDGQ